MHYQPYKNAPVCQFVFNTFVHLVSMLDPPNSVRKCSSAVRKTNLSIKGMFYNESIIWVFTFSLGNFLRTPPMSMQQTAVAVSAGIPTFRVKQLACFRLAEGKSREKYLHEDLKFWVNLFHVGPEKAVVRMFWRFHFKRTKCKLKLVTHQPWKPVLGHAPPHLHVPRVNEEHSSQFFTGFVDRVQLGGVEVQAFAAGADLEAWHAQLYTGAW